MKKIAIVMAILVLVIFASGCTSNDRNTSNTSSPQNNSNMQSNSGIVLQINSDTSWSGTLTYGGKTQSISGNGDATYNLGQNPGAITVNLQKIGNAGNLKVQIIKEGNVVVSQNNYGGQGTVSISYAS